MKAQTKMARRIGGREATVAVIPGSYAVSVGNPQTILPEGWSWRLLTELARLESGHTPSRRRPDYWGGDIPWIGIKDATANHGRTINSTNESTNELGIANSAARILPENTVCLSRTASVGYVVVMGRPMATSQDFVNWVCGPALDYRYLKYALIAEGDALLRFADGSVHQTIYFPEIKALHLATPPRKEQAAIADALSSLDDKIEVNRRINDTLEQMTQTIFREWFSTAQKHLHREQVGQICKLGVMALGDGYRAKNEELHSPGLPFIRAGDLNDGIHTHAADILGEASVARAGDKISREGDVAFTSKGTIGRFARVTKHTKPFVYSPQVCFWRSLDNRRLRPSILYAWMTSADLTSQIRGAADQSDMAPYVSLRDQRTMTMPLFDDEQHGIADMLDPLLELQAANLAENKTLAETRDYLLPKLMAGEVRVHAAQKMG